MSDDFEAAFWVVFAAPGHPSAVLHLPWRAAVPGRGS
jgi:hypothetical protein